MFVKATVPLTFSLTEYEGRSFDSGTIAPPYNMAVRSSNFTGDALDSVTQFYSNRLTLSKDTESSNRGNRKILAKIVCVYNETLASFKIRVHMKVYVNLDTSQVHSHIFTFSKQAFNESLEFFSRS